MKQFLFPAIFFKEEDRYTVLFPDLNITTDGETIEEAYLFAKDSLKVYCSYVEKFELEIDTPSKYELIAEKLTDLKQHQKSISTDNTHNNSSFHLTEKKTDYSSHIETNNPRFHSN